MIAAALALMLAADARATIQIELRQSGDRCTMTIGKDSVDPRDETAVTDLLSRYDPKRHTVEMIGDETVSYRCIGGVVYRLQSRGFQFAKVGYVMQSKRQ